MLKKRGTYIICFLALILIGCQPADDQKCDQGFIWDIDDCCPDGNNDGRCDVIEEPRLEDVATRDIIAEEDKPFEQDYKKMGLFGGQCEGTGSFKFKTFPLDIEDVEAIIPMGRVQDSHVTPTDHQYILPKGITSGSMLTDNPEQYEIKAPADGYIISVEIFKEPIEEDYRDQEYEDNYLVIMEHSCTFYSEMIHLSTLKPQILSQINFQNPDSQHPFGSGRVAVKEGEVIGTMGARSFDFYIIDTDINLDYINPEHFSGDFQAWKTHVVDTFDYLEEPLRSQLLAKNIRKVEPYGGRIDYDVDGTLLGNWYTDWDPEKVQEIIWNYWTREISIVYDYIDPSQIRISLGEFGGYPRAHGVLGNTPDPADISVEDGMVRYELVKVDYFDEDGNKWEGFNYADGVYAQNYDEVQGVVLLQMIEDSKLKVEVFAYVDPSTVTGFTDNALIYER
ncbi:hypothetical protein GOV09_03970 [Candidatus Woesearchaeota archaeon]|nr:hypothetical protein [Candidatus Woesearchaeota archaeon]